MSVYFRIKRVLEVQLHANKVGNVRYTECQLYLPLLMHLLVELFKLDELVPSVIWINITEVSRGYEQVVDTACNKDFQCHNLDVCALQDMSLTLTRTTSTYAPGE